MLQQREGDVLESASRGPDHWMVQISVQVNICLVTGDADAEELSKAMLFVANAYLKEQRQISLIIT